MWVRNDLGNRLINLSQAESLILERTGKKDAAPHPRGNFIIRAKGPGWDSVIFRAVTEDEAIAKMQDLQDRLNGAPLYI